MSKLTREEIESKYVARLKDRKLDWDVLKFQEEVDPRYRRAQMRYIGRGATANNDSNVIKATHFTLSTMVLPPGSIGPIHLHDDVEEVFFVLKGNLIAMVQEADSEEVIEIPLGERDCICCPPGLYRGVRNVGNDDALMMVILGSPTPNLPTYLPGSELEEMRIKRAKVREAIIQLADQS